MQKTSKKLFSEAKRYLVGGVNSPIRAFGAVGGNPVFIEEGYGSKVKDISGKEYIDYICSYGALILGHACPAVVKDVKRAISKGSSFGAPTKKETELAREICRAFPSVQKVRFTSSGTEAVMGAIKLSRGYTKREKIVKFRGCYHGWGVSHYIELPYNDITAVRKRVEKSYREIAAIIVEPVAGNMGVVVPDYKFLNELRNLSTKFNILLIFDEVITGFRVAYGGAQEVFEIKADITCLGKIIGGGFPVGAFGGRNDIMNLLAPEGSVYQAGTLSGNPVAVSAGLKTLEVLRKKNIYKQLDKKTKYLCDETGLNYSRIGSMFSFDLDNDTKYRRLFWRLLKKGIYFPPSSKETCFMSLAHTMDDINKTIENIQNTKIQ